MAPRSGHLPAAVCEAFFLLGITTAILVFSLWGGGFKPTDRLYIRDLFKATPYLDEILSQRELTLITLNNTQGYYTDRGRAMGFEYELARAFADFIGAELRVELAADREKMISKLEETSTGILAAGVAMIPSKEAGIVCSHSYLSCRPHIIVHRDNQEVRAPGDLAGRQVHIARASGCREILERYRTRGIEFEINEVGADMEGLAKGVAEKSIDVAVVWQHVALRSRRYFPQIVLGEAISETPISMTWAMDARAKGLLEQINLFLRTIREEGGIQALFDAYYADLWDFDFVDLRAFHRRLKGRLPKYRAVLQSAAEAGGFDWRLIAAQMYQESHFDARAKSDAPAYGLMQLTLENADYLNVADIYDPEENIRAGVRHLKYLYDYFDEARGTDRLYLALAAYNIGQGHLRDAQNLAGELGMDPNMWSAISEVLPLLSKRKYYGTSQYGFCRGAEPVTYVKQILLYYDILKYMEMPWVADGERLTADG